MDYIEIGEAIIGILMIVDFILAILAMPIVVYCLFFPF